MQKQCSNKIQVLSHSATEASFIKNVQKGLRFQCFTQESLPGTTQEKNFSGRAIVYWSEKYFFFSADAEVNYGAWELFEFSSFLKNYNFRGHYTTHVAKYTKRTV